VGGVQDDAGDVDEAGVVEPMQYGLVQPPPDAGSGPDQKPAVGGRLRYAEAGWQLAPGAAGHQHVDDRCEQRLIRRVLRPAALRSHLRRRDQRLRDLPQPVRNNPTPRTPPHAELNDASPRRTRSNDRGRGLRRSARGGGGQRCPTVLAPHVFGASDPEGFAAVGVVETLVHTYGIAQGLRRNGNPPEDLNWL